MEYPQVVMSEVINRLNLVARALDEQGCTRHEIFTYCLTIGLNLFLEVCQRQNVPITSLIYPEVALAQAIGQVIKNYPNSKEPL